MSRLPRPDQAITKTLNLAGNHAFMSLRKGKWRRAEAMAQDLLNELPPSMRKSPDALCLRLIGKAGRYIADWLAADKAQNARRKKRKRRAPGELASMTPELLLVPQSPAQVGDKQ